MYLEIITPEKMLFKGEVKLIQLPGSLSSFEILEHHAPIISTLKKGTLRIIDNTGQEKYFEISGGVVENLDSKVVALVEQRQL